MDAYKQSYYLGPRVNASLTKRMSWVYRRAGLAMLITSLTTACAFVATSLTSPIPTLQVFGIYAAAVIILDYVLVMTFLCSSVVIYHNYFENKPPPCCVCCTCAAPGSRLDWWLCNSSQHGGCESFCDCCGKPMETTTQKAMAQVDAAQVCSSPPLSHSAVLPSSLIHTGPKPSLASHPHAQASSILTGAGQAALRSPL